MSLPVRIICVLVWLLMALVPATLGFFYLRRSRKLHTEGVHTGGVIVGYDKKLVDGSWLYSPKVRFQSGDGETHTFIASSGSIQMPRFGRRVRVSYLPHAPEDADISSFGGISFAAVVLFLFAFGFFGASLIYLFGFN